MGGGVACDRLAVYACDKYPSLRTTLFGGVRWGAMKIAPIVSAMLILVVFPLWVLMVVPDQSWASLVAEAIFGVFDGILGIVLILIALELFPVSVRDVAVDLLHHYDPCARAADARLDQNRVELSDGGGHPYPRKLNKLIVELRYNY